MRCATNLLVALGACLLATVARAGLGTAGVARRLPLGPRLVEAVSGVMHAAAPTLVPHVTPDLPLPRAAPFLPARRNGLGPRGAGASDREIVYFPSCLTRVVGALPGEDAAPPARAIEEVLRWAGLGVRTPAGVEGLQIGRASCRERVFRTV